MARRLISAFFIVFCTLIGIIAGEVCQQNWDYFNGNCYLIVSPMIAPVSPLEARQKCLSKKADLVSIGSEAEDFFVRGLIAKMDTARDDHLHRYTIGMSLTRDELGAIKSAEWHDKLPMSFGNPTEGPAGTHPWANNEAIGHQKEPSANRTANCVSMLRSRRTCGDWAVNSCQDVKGGYICKYVAEKASDVLIKKSLSDKPEGEVVCHNGYVKFARNCYKVYESSITTPATSELACQADGGHLASIHSEEEDIFIKGLVNHLNPGHAGVYRMYHYAIGMQLERDPEDGTITAAKWRNEEPIQYGDPTVRGFLRGTGPWASGNSWNGQQEPNVRKEATSVFLAMSPQSGGEWRADTPSTVGGYVCQMKGVTE